MDQMMYSLPAEQALAGIKNASDKVAALDNALKGMEDTMQLFYHHKGLSNQEAAVKNSEIVIYRFYTIFMYLIMFTFNGSYIAFQFCDICFNCICSFYSCFSINT